MKLTRSSVTRAVTCLLECVSLRQAIVYVAPNFVVKATRQRKPTLRTRGETFLVTVGNPAYLERRFIKTCLKAGEPFPVKKVQLKSYRK